MKIVDILFSTESQIKGIVEKTVNNNPGKQLTVSIGFKQGTFGKNIIIETK